MKTKWEKPQLVILVRSRPEEAILQQCKALGDAGGLAASFAISPAGADTGCYLLAVGVACQQCDTDSPS